MLMAFASPTAITCLPWVSSVMAALSRPRELRRRQATARGRRAWRRAPRSRRQPRLRASRPSARQSILAAGIRRAPLLCRASSCQETQLLPAPRDCAISCAVVAFRWRACAITLNLVLAYVSRVSLNKNTNLFYPTRRRARHGPAGSSIELDNSPCHLGGALKLVRAAIPAIVRMHPIQEL